MFTLLKYNCHAADILSLSAESTFSPFWNKTDCWQMISQWHSYPSLFILACVTMLLHLMGKLSVQQNRVSTAFQVRLQKKSVPLWKQSKQIQNPNWPPLRGRQEWNAWWQREVPCEKRPVPSPARDCRTLRPISQPCFGQNVLVHTAL